MNHGSPKNHQVRREAAHFASAVERDLIRAASAALAAYQSRFESVAPPIGNYIGPIDEEMAALHEAVRRATGETT